MKFKYTIPGQLLSVLRAHAVMAVMFSLLWLIAMSLWVTNVGSYIFVIIGTISYFFSMYNAGFAIVSDDKKPYSSQTPKLSKCLILTAFLAIVNIAMIVFYKATWALASDGQSLNSVGGVVGNVISMAWFSMYEKLLGMGKGHFSLLGYLIIFFLPLISTAAGYVSGYVGIDINDKLIGFMYEKKKKSKA